MPPPPAPPPLQAIIFDCDGVLVDSEILGNQILAQVLTEHGYPCTTEHSVATFMGNSLEGVVKKASELAGRDMRHACENVYMPRLLDAFANNLTPIEGMHALVASLALPKAVASSSPVVRLETSLRRAAMRDLFHPHIYSAEHVAHPKPAPDLFLHTAAMLQVPPDSCLVIEDSLGGIAAAHAAGMRCIAFAGGGHCNAAHVEKLRSSTALHAANTVAELARQLARHLAA